MFHLHFNVQCYKLDSLQRNRKDDAWFHNNGWLAAVIHAQFIHIWHKHHFSLVFVKCIVAKGNFQCNIIILITKESTWKQVIGLLLFV